VGVRLGTDLRRAVIDLANRLLKLTLTVSDVGKDAARIALAADHTIDIEV